MKVTVNQPLWEKIQNFRIDDPRSTIKFSDKLASENNWTPAYAQRAIEEYRRFMFLCCISPTGASPSYDVDQVWHLHLTYTHNYWKEFCRDTLGKEIHHHPSRGGTDEDHRHTDWYEETLKLYRSTFNENPPADIWPVAHGSNPAQLQKEASFAYQLIIIAAIAIPLLITYIREGTHPFALYGPGFLWFYGGLILSAIIAILIHRWIKIKWAKGLLEKNYHGDANVYQVARFAYGRNRSVQTAIIELSKRGVLTANNHGKFIFTPSAYQQVGFETNPLINGLMKFYSEGHELSYYNVDACYDADATYHSALASIHSAIANRYRFAWPLVIIVLLTGIARCMQGISNDRPIAYLVMLMIVAALGFAGGYRVSKYREILAIIFGDGYRNQTLGASFQVSSELSQFAFFGVTVLATGYLSQELLHTFDTQQRNNTSSSSSCGSGGCGSSDGGSSCGGGGCGGGGD